MALAAEVWQMPEEIIEPDQPPIILVPEMPEDELIRWRAERLIRGIGSEILRHEVAGLNDSKNETGKFESLMDAIHAVHKGNLSGRPVIEANVRTDMMERAYKAGIVTRVELSVSENEQIEQHGQSLEDIRINALRFTATVNDQMRERVEAETRNSYRIESLRRQGLLKDYSFVVLSPYPDNMTDKLADELGFFTDNKSCVIQTITEEDGHLVQESAFVAGVEALGKEPHYKRTLAAFGDKLGVPLAGKTSAETIDSPFLVPKKLMPNGVAIGLVEQMWDYNGTFFGEAKPRQDYLNYLETCQSMMAKFEPIVQEITDTLVYYADSIKTPLEAIQRLDRLSQRALVDRAFDDKTINPRVFGPEAARYIEVGRRMLEEGDLEHFQKVRNFAQDTANSSSCPSGLFSKSDQTSQNAASTGEKKKMTCPFCKDKNQWGDPCSPNQHCTHCGATVKNGKIVPTEYKPKKFKSKNIPILQLLSGQTKST